MQTDTTLKTYFEAGDTPTSAEFDELIDSKRHVWDDHAYCGVAVTTTVPTITNRNVFYFASQAGTYTNINSLVVYPGEVAVLKLTVNPTTGIGVWSKDVIFRPASFAVTTEAYGLNYLQAGLDDSGATEPTAIDLRCVTTANTPTYQWYYKETTADDWAEMSGETSEYLTFDIEASWWGDRKQVIVRCVVTDVQSYTYASNAVCCYRFDEGGEIN